MGQPYIAEIRVVSFNFPPKGWAFCNGQVLPINQNQALFSILGTTYGGDGRTTFALPNLQGRMPIHFGQGFTLGEVGGATAHTLAASEMPAHTHVPMAQSGAGVGAPGGATWGTGPRAIYTATPDTPMSGAVVSGVGGSQPHENMAPYLTLSFVIALVGIFPSQN